MCYSSSNDKENTHLHLRWPKEFCELEHARSFHLIRIQSERQPFLISNRAFVRLMKTLRSEDQ